MGNRRSPVAATQVSVELSGLNHRTVAHAGTRLAFLSDRLGQDLRLRQLEGQVHRMPAIDEQLEFKFASWIELKSEFAIIIARSSGDIASTFEQCDVNTS